MVWRPLPLYVALLVFLLSCLAVLYSVEHRVRWLAVVALGGMIVAAVLFLLSMWPLRRHRVDWNRIHAEQRLWESGPLGRAWLRIRQRLARLWKL